MKNRKVKVKDFGFQELCPVLVPFVSSFYSIRLCRVRCLGIRTVLPRPRRGNIRRHGIRSIRRHTLHR